MSIESKVSNFIRYMKQPSTWQGVAVVAGALGYTLAPEYQNAIIAGGGLLLGLIQIMKDEDRERTNVDELTKDQVAAKAIQMGLIKIRRKE